MEKKNIGKIIISILLIAVAVVVFSPSLQGFLPENIKTGINAFIDEHFAENASSSLPRQKNFPLHRTPKLLNPDKLQPVANPVTAI